MATAAADIFRRAAELNTQDDRRRGNCIHLPSPSRVIVAGDIHGNRGNLSKIISYASLANNPDNYLVLQELIHGPIDQTTGHDRSCELLLRAARLKIANPKQVLFVMGNHDLSQVTGNEIIKSGRGVCRLFADGVKAAFDPAGAEVLEAIGEFLKSTPLAVMCDNGVLISHSAPSPRDMADGSAAVAIVKILSRQSNEQDMTRGGALYQWLWGRGQTAEQLEVLGEQLGVKFFVMGHRKIDAGHEFFAGRAVAIESDDHHGCVFSFSTEAPLTPELATNCVKQISML